MVFTLLCPLLRNFHFSSNQLKTVCLYLFVCVWKRRIVRTANTKRPPLELLKCKSWSWMLRCTWHILIVRAAHSENETLWAKLPRGEQKGTATAAAVHWRFNWEKTITSPMSTRRQCVLLFEELPLPREKLANRKFLRSVRWYGQTWRCFIPKRERDWINWLAERLINNCARHRDSRRWCCCWCCCKK